MYQGVQLTSILAVGRTGYPPQRQLDTPGKYVGVSDGVLHVRTYNTAHCCVRLTAGVELRVRPSLAHNDDGKALQLCLRTHLSDPLLLELRHQGSRGRVLAAVSPGRRQPRQ
jgi:hypothetical protein